MFFTSVLVFLWPQKFVATATLFPALEVETPLSKMLDYQRINFGILLGGQNASPSDLYAGILNSRTIKEKVINRCQLMTVFKKKSPEDMLRTLSKISKVDVSREQIVSLEVTTHDPDLSASIANAWIDELDIFNQQSLISQAKKKRIFLEARLKEIDNELKEAEDSVRFFQLRYKTVSIDQEIKKGIEAYSQLRITLLTQEVKLKCLPEAESTLPLYREIHNEITAIKTQIKAMEEEWGSGYGLGFGVPLKSIPKVQFEYARKVRTRNSLSELYTYLLEEYEDAKVEEVRTTPTIIIVDRATPPEKRIWPKRISIILFGIITAASISLLIPLYLENLSFKFKNAKTLLH